MSGTKSLALLIALAAALCLWAAPAGAAVTLTEGANTAVAPKFEWDFGNEGLNIEWVEGLKWKGAESGTFGPSLAAYSGVVGGGCGGAPGEFWGQSYGNADGQGPGPVVTGNRGSWTPRGQRSIEINSLAQTPCSGDEPAVPVRTRYSFFEEGPAANTVRMERRWSFALNQEPYIVQGMRAYVPRLPVGTYNQEIYPKDDGSLVTEGICNVCIRTGSGVNDWNQTWIALNSAATNAGMLILRDPGSTGPASLTLDYDSSSGSNNSGISLDRPLPNGWLAPLTETEYFCFYDASSWPPAERSATRLPDGCVAASPPINTQPPALSAGAGAPRAGERFFAAPGKWDNATGAFGYQWSRCLEDVCQPIAGATGTEYVATTADVGRSLKVTVTAAAPGGETDSAESNVAGAISGNVYLGSKAPGNLVAFAPVQVCRRSGAPCRSTTTDANGLYRVQAPLIGKYRVTAFPPAGLNAVSRTRPTLSRVKAEVEKADQDVVLGVVKPPPPQVGFSGSGVRGQGAEGVPVVHWQEPFTITYKAPIVNEVEARVEFADGQVLRVLPQQPVEASPNDPGTGIFRFLIQPLIPNHGAARVTIVSRAPRTVVEIEEDEEEVEEEETPEEEDEEPTFPIYIDPSGYVRTVSGAPLSDAKVTLLQSQAKTGPFVMVPNGSAVMSPMNRVNSDQSEADGHFGWDVIAGFYKVIVQKPGCYAPGSPGQPLVETHVMTIPPPVTDLDLRLECAGPGGPGGSPASPSSQPQSQQRRGVVISLPASAVVKVGKDGRFKVSAGKVECPGGGSPCAVEISATAPAPPKTAKKGGRRARVKAVPAVALGLTKLTLAAGKSSILEGKLSAGGLRKLKQAKRLKATIAVVGTVPDGDAATGTLKATLQAPPAKKPPRRR